MHRRNEKKYDALGKALGVGDIPRAVICSPVRRLGVPGELRCDHSKRDVAWSRTAEVPDKHYCNLSSQ
jgi:hypothetical protein